MLQCGKRGGVTGRASEKLGRGRYGKSKTRFIRRVGIILIVSACWQLELKVNYFF